MAKGNKQKSKLPKVDIIENTSLTEGHSERKLEQLIKNIDEKAVTSYSEDESSEGSSSNDSVSESEVEVEDEEGALINPNVDAQVLKTWLLLRDKDPRIYNKETKFYDESVFKEAENEWLKAQEEIKTNPKVITLPDIVRQRLEKGIADPEEDDKSSLPPPRTRTMVEEQSHLKRAFLEATKSESDSEAENEEEGSFFSVKPKSKEEMEVEQKEFQHNVLASLSSADDRFLQMLESNQNTPEDIFLLNYVLKKGWVDQQGTAAVKAEEDLEQDAREVEAAELFEQEYNFRFERPQLAPCPRDVPESLRRKKETRKLARQRKREREQASKRELVEKIKKEKREKRKAGDVSVEDLDFEDLVDGKPVRFVYQQVEPKSFGLTAKKILETDDATLDKLVSKRKLAPYAQFKKVFRHPHEEERPPKFQRYDDDRSGRNNTKPGRGRSLF